MVNSTETTDVHSYRPNEDKPGRPVIDQQKYLFREFQFKSGQTAPVMCSLRFFPPLHFRLLPASLVYAWPSWCCWTSLCSGAPAVAARMACRPLSRGNVKLRCFTSLPIRAVEGSWPGVSGVWRSGSWHRWGGRVAWRRSSTGIAPLGSRNTASSRGRDCKKCRPELVSGVSIRSCHERLWLDDLRAGELEPLILVQWGSGWKSSWGDRGCTVSVDGGRMCLGSG